MRCVSDKVKSRSPVGRIAVDARLVVSTLSLAKHTAYPWVCHVMAVRSPCGVTKALICNQLGFLARPLLRVHSVYAAAYVYRLRSFSCGVFGMVIGYFGAPGEPSRGDRILRINAGEHKKQAFGREFGDGAVGY